MNEHAAYANGLREIADWIESHPEFAPPNKDISGYSLNERSEAAALLAALKPCKKEYHDEIFTVSRDFGPVTLRYLFFRSKVCVARIVGQKVIPEVREPAKIIEIPERITPAHTEDIIEWDCGEPLLKTPEETVPA